MAQKSQVIDLRKSYIPGDPNAIHQNLVNTQREDAEEQTMPIVPYEGYNFLPTSYGYRSYFGTAGTISLDNLPSRTQHCLIYQTPDYKRHYIALSEDGIWISQPDKSWLQVVTHTYNSNVFEQWTYTLIENAFYFYKQGKSVVYKTTYDENFVLSIDSFTPSFLNMAGQIGIFKAGTRLGMWDSDNSISWSSTFDFTDFTPSIETLAGNTKFNAGIGKIVTIKTHGEGFVVYYTKSIVTAIFNMQGNMLWDGREVYSNIGIQAPFNVVEGSDNAEHFAYTTAGIVRIGKYSRAAGKFESEFVFPEIFDFLRESRLPVMLHCIHKRFLTFSLFDDRYITRLASATRQIIDPSLTVLTLAEGYWEEDIDVLPDVIDGNMLRTIIDQFLEGNLPVITETCP